MLMEIDVGNMLTEKKRRFKLRLESKKMHLSLIIQIFLNASFLVRSKTCTTYGNKQMHRMKKSNNNNTFINNCNKT